MVGIRCSRMAAEKAVAHAPFHVELDQRYALIVQENKVMKLGNMFEELEMFLAGGIPIVLGDRSQPRHDCYELAGISLLQSVRRCQRLNIGTFMETCQSPNPLALMYN